MFSLKNQFSIRFLNLIGTRFNSLASSVNAVSWSLGEKEYPIMKKRDTEFWYKIEERKKKKKSKKMLHPVSGLDPKHKNNQFPYTRPDGGIQHFRFVYYPRFPDVEDEKITPTPLLFVKQTKYLTNRPYWEKNIMREIGLDKRVHKHTKKNFVVVKNVPEMNSRLYIIKHLVEIKPLKFPENMPADPNPLDYFITNDGEVLYQPTITLEALEDDTLEKQKYSSEWVDTKMRQIYNYSLDLEF